MVVIFINCLVESGFADKKIRSVFDFKKLSKNLIISNCPNLKTRLFLINVCHTQV